MVQIIHEWFEQTRKWSEPLGNMTNRLSTGQFRFPTPNDRGNSLP